jgi:rhodanese-related sulfurtransferase
MVYIRKIDTIKKEVKTMPKLIVINALSKNYYDECHIEGSISVPLDKIESYAQKLDKKTPIVVYCASYSCPISEKAWRIFTALGFTTVWAYEGGIAEWNQKKYPCVGSCQEDYLSRQEKPPKRDVKTISAEELKKKMEEAGLL